MNRNIAYGRSIRRLAMAALVGIATGAAAVGIAVADEGGVVILPDGTSRLHRDLIIARAAHRLPVVYPFRFFVAAGGLMSYGTDVIEQNRQAASFVDRILRGADPATLPVQTPIKYETILNLKTARALGFDVPSTLLVRADEVIE
jgi:putative ABC transport system substrate-binding protein